MWFGHLLDFAKACDQAVFFVLTGSISMKLIIDTDLGWDDVLALVYLLKRDDLDILGISVSGVGETNLYWGLQIASAILGAVGREDIPIALGSSVPLKYDHAFPQVYKDDINSILGLIGMLIPVKGPNRDTKNYMSSEDWLAQTICENEDVTILSLGGLTNIANTLKKYSDLPLNHIRNLFIMGGAVLVDGNISLFNNARPEWNQGELYKNNFLAEWNIFVDPLAAQMVLHTIKNIQLIPLDVCNNVILNDSHHRGIFSQDILANLARRVLQNKLGAYSQNINVPVFDPLAAVIATGGLKKYSGSSVYLDVDVTNSPESSGNTFVVNSG